MRTYAADTLDLLDAGRIAIAGMIRFDFGEGSYGLIRARAPYTWGGLTYNPLPNGLITVSALPRTTGTAATGFRITLSASPDTGLTPEQILQIEDYDYLDRPVTVYDLHCHPDTGAVLGAPQAMMRGYINSMSHEGDEDSGHLLVAECESRAMDYSRRNGRVRSHADQQRRAPGDRFFEHAGTAGRIQIKFGKT